MKIINLLTTFIGFKACRLILVVTLLSLHAGVTAQNQKVSLSGSQTIQNAFEQIEKQAGVTIAYSESLIDVNQNITVDISNKSLPEALTEILKNTNATFEVKNKQILIVEKTKQQQTYTVTGIVVDNLNEPIIGASILEIGSANGTITNAEGRFSLNVASNATLLISYMGYINKEVAVNGKNSLNIVLQEDAQLLDEIVVVGYGVQKKSDLTGAISVVKQKDLPPAANTSVAHMLAGKATGLTALQQSAQPGGGMKLQIRGAASNRSPLVIIDGFPQNDFSVPDQGYGQMNDDSKLETSLNSINPNDIESIEVLKDASATSIYGSRAAGGVILITTKRGKEGKVKVNYKASLSTQHLYKLPTMLNPTQFMTESNEATKEKWMRDKGVYPYGSNSYEDEYAKSPWNPVYSDVQITNPPTGTDWIDEVTRVGFIHEHNLSVQGGSENTKYLASLNYYDQKGVVEKSNLERFNMRVNLDQKFSDIISGGLTLNINQVKNNNIPLSGKSNEGSGIINSAQIFNPLLPVRDENGEYSLDPKQGYLANPVSLLEIQDITTSQRALLLGYVEANLFNQLKIKAQLGVDRNQAKKDFYMPTSVLFGKREGGYAIQAENTKQDYNFNLTANWHKVINDHDISLMAGYDYQYFTWSNFNAGNSNFPYAGMLWYNLEAGSRERPIVGSSGGNAKLASYIARVNYVYKNRYMLTANFRADGSSSFAENKKWGYFPGVSIGWKIHEEAFMKEATSNWLSELK